MGKHKAAPSARTALEYSLEHRQRRERLGPTGVERQLGDNLAGLRLGQTVIHGPVEVVGDLFDLAGRDQSADGDQAPVPWRKTRAEPEVAEQNVGGVTDDFRSDRAELLSDARRPLRLGGLVERQKRRRRWRKLVTLDSASREDLACDRDRRHGVGPAGIEREMRDDLG